MKQLSYVAAFLLFVAAGTQASPMTADEQALAARSQEFATAWNRHDAKAIAAMFTDDADLINPFGRWAHGRAEVEKLFTDEQSGVMKPTTYSCEIANIQWIKPDVAVVTWKAHVDGLMGPDGKAAPRFDHFVTWVGVKKNGQWWFANARPAAMLPPPAAPPAH